MEHISIDPLTPSFSAKYKSDNDNNNNIINNKNEPQELILFISSQIPHYIKLK